MPYISEFDKSDRALLAIHDNVQEIVKMLDEKHRSMVADLVQEVDRNLMSARDQIREEFLQQRRYANNLSDDLEACYAQESHHDDKAQNGRKKPKKKSKHSKHAIDPSCAQQ